MVLSLGSHMSMRTYCTTKVEFTKRQIRVNLRDRIHLISSVGVYKTRCNNIG